MSGCKTCGAKPGEMDTFCLVEACGPIDSATLWKETARRLQEQLNQYAPNAPDAYQPAVDTAKERDRYRKALKRIVKAAHGFGGNACSEVMELLDIAESALLKAPKVTSDE